jgi:CHAP domain
MRTIGAASVGLRCGKRRWQTLSTLLAVGLVALVASGTGRAAATAAQLVTAPTAVRAGFGAEFIVALANVPSCTVSVPGADRTVATAGADRVAFSVDVRGDARPGVRPVTIDCSGAAPVSFSLTVLGPVGRPAGESWPVADTVYYAVHQPSLTARQAWAYAQQRWKSEGTRFMAGFRNGQCTDLAARKRPDVVERVYEASVAAFLLARPFPSLDFTARNWAKLARAAGLVVSSRPVKGAIVVWQPGVEGAGAGTGHVAYVTSTGHGTFSTIEENVGKPYAIGHRNLPAKPLPGRLFIHPGQGGLPLLDGSGRGQAATPAP